MNATRTTTRATAKAQRYWGECFLHVRGELRAGGVRGDLRRVDERAAGTRGRAVPIQHYNDALEMAAHGVPRDAWKARVCEAVSHFVDLAYDAHGQRNDAPLKAA